MKRRVWKKGWVIKRGGGWGGRWQGERLEFTRYVEVSFPLTCGNNQDDNLFYSWMARTNFLCTLAIGNRAKLTGVAEEAWAEEVLSLLGTAGVFKNLIRISNVDPWLICGIWSLYFCAGINQERTSRISRELGARNSQNIIVAAVTRTCWIYRTSLELEGYTRKNFKSLQ